MILEVSIQARVWVDDSIPVQLLLLDKNMDLPMFMSTTKPGRWSTRLPPPAIQTGHTDNAEARPAPH